MCHYLHDLPLLHELLQYFAVDMPLDNLDTLLNIIATQAKLIKERDQLIMIMQSKIE